MKHSTYFPDCFYRVTVKGLCVRDGKVLLVRESEKTLSGKWEMPGGGLDFGEDIKAGLKREIQEEMGHTVTKISEKPAYVWTHRYESNRRKVGWYYSLALTFRVEFENLDFTPSEECIELAFFSKEDLNNLPLSGQANELSEIFNPEDFEGSF